MRVTVITIDVLMSDEVGISATDSSPSSCRPMLCCKSTLPASKQAPAMQKKWDRLCTAEKS